MNSYKYGYCGGDCMKLLCILIMLCCPFAGRAQESFEDFPLSPLTGQVSSRFYATYKAPSRDPDIKFVTFSATYKPTEGLPDTSLNYQAFLAPNGAVLGAIWAYIPDQHYLAASAAKHGKFLRAYYRHQTGGGFEMPFITTNFYTDYVFKKGRLISEEDGAVKNSRRFGASPLPKDPELVKGGSRIDYTYNKRGRLETATATTHLDSEAHAYYQACSYYRYDKQGRRISTFNLDIKNGYTAPSYDTLAQLPDSLGKILMRNFAPGNEDLPIPGIMATIEYGDDEDTALVALTKLQDSLDEKVVKNYTRQATGVVTYEYDSKGRPSGRLQFQDEELEVKDTFYYDAADRCIGWHSIDLGGDGVHTYSRLDKEWQSVGNNPSLSDWIFEYDAQNRVSKAIFKLYSTPTRYQYKLKEATELTLEKVYELVYRDDGLLGQIHLASTVPKRTYGTTDTHDFVILYERY